MVIVIAIFIVIPVVIETIRIGVRIAKK
jgi:hypothetical protein